MPIATNWNSKIASALRKKHGVRSMQYIRYLSEMVDDNVNAGVFMSQLLFWWGKGIKKEWIYKTISEIRDETGLTKDQQATAIKIWERAGFLEKKLMGIPPKRHFKINLQKLMDFLEISDLFEKNNQ